MIVLKIPMIAECPFYNVSKVEFLYFLKFIKRDDAIVHAQGVLNNNNFQWQISPQAHCLSMALRQCKKNQPKIVRSEAFEGGRGDIGRKARGGEAKGPDPKPSYA